MVAQSDIQEIGSKLDKLIDIIARAVPPIAVEVNFEDADAFVWHAMPDHLVAY